MIREAPEAHKGIYYWCDFHEARDFATEKDLPTDRIIPYNRGWVIQRVKSGPYYGPEGWK